MPSIRYLFVFDEPEPVFFSSDEPTAEDFEHAQAGLGTIIRLADACYYGREGKWEPVPEGRLGTTDVDGTPTRPFHAPASYFAESLKLP